MRPSLVEEIVACVRAAPTAGYSERQELLKKAARAARALCSKLQRHEAAHARPAFFAVLEMPLNGTCVPECCDASYIRAIQIEAKCEVLTTWRRLDPHVANDLPPSMVADLVIPTSKRIALAAIELLERSPTASRTHLELVIEALEHPRWQVAECAARMLGRVGPFAKKQALASLTKALRHAQWQVRKAVAKAMGRMVIGKHERLADVAARDRHPAVRYAASKALGIQPPRPNGEVRLHS